MSGKIFYGMHFYPGLAQYNKPSGESYKILLTEEVLRKMDPTFAGKPGFVEHVDEVPADRKVLKNEADLWVIESFYNPPDGKHWVKFVTVTDEAENAIGSGYKLSNAYNPIMNGMPGKWNNIDYNDGVASGEYEHLAITKNPRYNESVIMTPEEFKSYNENLKEQLDRISNSQEQENHMGLKDIIFKKVKIENALDYENAMVCLPKTRKEFTILQLVNAMDEMEEKKKENEASSDMKVKLHDGTYCNVGELVDRYKDSSEKLAGMLKDCSYEVKNDEEDEEAKRKALELAEHENKEIKEDKMKNSNDKINFETLKNAHLNAPQVENRFYTDNEKLARGKSMFGSN